MTLVTPTAGIRPTSTTRLAPDELPVARPPRLSLQRAASRNIRRHWMRDALRVGVLVVSDIAIFVTSREVVEVVRDDAVMGTGLASLVSVVAPQGLLGGWQFAVALVIALLVAGSYGPGDYRRDSARLLGAATLASLLALYGSFWSGPVVLVTARWILIAVGLTVPLVLSRFVVDLCVRRLAPRFMPNRLIVVSDTGRDWIDIRPFVAGARNEMSRFRSVGTVSANGASGSGGVRLSELSRMIDQECADAVLIAGALSDADFGFVVDTAAAAGCRLLAASRTTRVAGVEPRVLWEGGQALVELTALSLKGWQMAVKRVMDVAAAGLGLLVLSPLFLSIAVWIKLDSPGPVFFRQTRVGRAGRSFKILKFRSMVVGAEERLDSLRGESIYSDPRLFKVPHDPRVTRLGWWLRRTSIDEVPQLINVLKGEMSLVGPRPPLPSEVTGYEERHFCRFDVKPGITGPWQVSGRNHITDFEEVMRLEAQYIRNWSLTTDFAIILKTIPVVIGMRGAL